MIFNCINCHGSRRRPIVWLLLPPLLAVIAGCGRPPPPPAAAVAATAMATPATGPLGFPPAAAAAGGSAAGEGRGGVVAVAEPLAAAAGAAVLAAGGNAIDAAVTIQAMLAVTEPQSSGLGGGGFALLHLAPAATGAAAAGAPSPEATSGGAAAGGETVVLDFRETAPAGPAAGHRPDAGGDFRRASTAGAAVGVPATVRAMARALEWWGTVPLATALAPAIAAAEQGIVVSPRLAAAIAGGLAADRPSGGPGDPAGGGRLGVNPGVPAWETARAVFAPGGRPPAAGDRLRQPDLARTLRWIGRDGAAAFYRCRHPAGIARAIIATQRAGHPAAAAEAEAAAGGGRMACADLEGYDVVRRRPVEGRYRGYRILSVPPPSSGGVALLQMLAVLERFPLGAPDPAGAAAAGGDPAGAAAAWGPGGVATLNVIQEAMRLAYADRARWLGDPAFFPVPVAGLLDAGYLRHRGASCAAASADADAADAATEAAAGDGFCVRPGQRLAGIVAGTPAAGGDTTHFTVADRFGNVVAWTGTIEATWGSGLMVPGHGFLLNNQLTDFNRPPAGTAAAPAANDALPGKRPRSSITPVLVYDGPRPVAALGSPGGATIPNTVLLVLLGLIDHRLPIAQAIAAPRLSLTSAGDGAVTLVEPGWDAAVLARLAAICSDPGDAQTCYRFRETEAIGSVQAVVIDPAGGRRQGGADRRRDGTVIALP